MTQTTEPSNTQASTSTASAPSQPPPNNDYRRAASLISIWGPCRRVGDEYLSCVVTAGMGQCKPLRRLFETCAQETSGHAVGLLDQLALQACGHVEENAVAKRNCAAEVLLRSQPQGPMQ